MKIKLETEAKIFLQKSVLDGNMELIWSYLLDFENYKNPYLDKKNAIHEWRYLACKIIYENEDIIKEAEQIIKTGLKVYDSLHIAAAIHAKADYFFSTDKRILKYKSDKIIIMNPIDYIKELS